FAPRFGFAYSPKRYGLEDKLVIRGGAGVSYNRIPEIVLPNSRANPPFAAGSHGRGLRRACGHAGCVRLHVFARSSIRVALQAHGDSRLPGQLESQVDSSGESTLRSACDPTRLFR